MSEYDQGAIEVRVMNPDAPKWTSVPHQITDAVNLTWGARLAGILYICHIDEGRARVAELLNLTDRALAVLDNELIAAGILERKRIDGETTYVLTCDV